ncbi:hypothetical protein [Georgenia sp. SUBG003]|uniref:hypothetical protein n=1 Tax=Georgenia sp. SUBG003 TaxID=1497974 RepID=UPI0004D428AB|nr:hypothetical protein DA06_00585 [Georgenia sp. SUBG003]
MTNQDYEPDVYADDEVVLDDDLFADDDEEESDDDESDDVVRARWVMDGARTLSQAARKLEAFAQELRELEESGWQLTGPVENDHGIIRQVD